MTSSKFPGPLVRVAGEGHAPSSGCGKKQKGFLYSVVGFPSGQREQTVNLSSYDFGGSNPPPTTSSTLV